VALGVPVGVGVAVAVTVEVGVGVEVGVPVEVGVAVGLAVAVGVGGGPDCAQYLPPVFVRVTKAYSPPQTIISLPVQTAV